MKNKMYENLTFNDVLIEPQYSEVCSRSNVDISTNIGDYILSLPIISANMKHVTESKMALEMSNNGGLGILHRFCSIEENMLMWQNTRAPAGVSVGVQESDFNRAIALYELGAKIFCVDVAHGHHVLVKKAIERLKTLGDDICIIAGNIATSQATYALSEWGADVVKVGIGPGSVCQTRRNTGVGVPQLDALKNVKNQVENQRKKVKIIADGGIVSPGDIAKALKFADAVMVGSLIAGTSETPGDVFRGENNQLYKVYGGSASGESKKGNGQETKFVEGMTKQVPFKGHVKYILREISDGVKSAFSYSNANNLKEFQERCKLIKISSGGRIESKL